MTARRAQPHINIVPFKKLRGFIPRGVAIWVFYFADDPGEPWCPRVHRWNGKLYENSQLVPMTYTAAKDLARAEARRRGVTSISLDPNPL